MITVPLTRGLSCIIDDEDADLAEYTWKAERAIPYAYRTKGRGSVRRITLHRVIMSRKMGRDFAPGERVDHIDGNALNNTRDNLRVCTPSQNSTNIGLTRRNTSGYKGVTWNKRYRKWQASITVDRKCKYLGSFATPQEAYAAYCEAALKYHGEFARLR